MALSRTFALTFRSGLRHLYPVTSRWVASFISRFFHSNSPALGVSGTLESALFKSVVSVFTLKKFAFVVLLFPLGLFTGCEPKAATAELGTSKEMIAVLTPKIPVGTSLTAAKAYMTEQGFTIEEMKKARWKKTPDLNFLLCKRLDGQPPIKRQWEVALMNDGKAVTSLDVRTALVYP